MAIGHSWIYHSIIIIICIFLGLCSWLVRHYLNPILLHPSIKAIQSWSPKAILIMFGGELIIMMLWITPCWFLQVQAGHYMTTWESYLLSGIIADILIEPCMRLWQHVFLIKHWNNDDENESLKNAQRVL